MYLSLGSWLLREVTLLRLAADDAAVSGPSQEVRADERIEDALTR